MSLDPLQAAQQRYDKLREANLTKSRRIEELESKQKELENEITVLKKTVVDTEKKTEDQLKSIQKNKEEQMLEVNQLRDSLTKERAELVHKQQELEKESQSLESLKTHLTEESSKLTAQQESLAIEKESFKHEIILVENKLQNELLAQTNKFMTLLSERENKIKDLTTENLHFNKNICELENNLILAQRSYRELEKRREEELSETEKLIQRLKLDMEENTIRSNQTITDLNTTITSMTKEYDDNVQQLTTHFNEEVLRLNNLLADQSKSIAALAEWDSLRTKTNERIKDLEFMISSSKVELESLSSRYQSLANMSATRERELNEVIQQHVSKISELEKVIETKNAALKIYHDQIKQNAIQKSNKEKQDKERLEKEKLEKEKEEQKSKEKSGFMSRLFGSKDKSNINSSQSNNPASASTTSTTSSTPASNTNTTTNASTSNTLSAPTSTTTSNSTPPSPSPALLSPSELPNDLSEEIAVALTRRVEKLEEEKLALTSELKQMKNMVDSYRLVLHETHGNSTKDNISSTSHGKDDNNDSKKSPSPTNHTLSATHASSHSSHNLTVSGPTNIKEKDIPLLFEKNTKLELLLTDTLKLNESLEKERNKLSSENKRLKDLVDVRNTELEEANAKLKERKVKN